MKRFLRILVWSLIAIVGVAVLAYGIAWWMAESRYHRRWVAHEASFPIPFALSDAELEELRQQADRDRRSAENTLSGVDLNATALERAVARGERLVTTRTGCGGCHGDDFGGATLIDSPVLGRWAAPNLTMGKGSVTLNYDAADWDQRSAAWLTPERPHLEHARRRVHQSL